jgi:oxygen-independent coproporphyrinogen-3 oxidase
MSGIRPVSDIRYPAFRLYPVLYPVSGASLEATSNFVVNLDCRSLDCDTSTEISLEANPGDVLGRVSSFQLAGITRLSLGVQSLHDDDLVFFNRDHTAHEALLAIEECVRVYANHFSVDLIFGRPGQTLAAWLTELDRLVALGTQHVSLYQLTVEKGTQLHRLVNSKQEQIENYF